MKHLFVWMLFALLGSGRFALADPVEDWRQANERVDQAGGWKAYAREIAADASQSATDSSATKTLLSLQMAISRALALDPGLEQSLVRISRNPADYLSLGDQDRSALSREARLIAQVSGLYHAAVAAQERVAHRQQVAEVASVAAELATRMRKVGNLNLLHQAEEQLSAAQTQKSLSEARVAAGAAREALIRRLQLDAQATDFALPSRLPDAPPQPALPSPTDAALLRVQVSHPETIALQSAVREAMLVRDEAFSQVQHHRQEILPLQKRISEEHLLHYNGMIIGVFELLKDAKHQTEAVEGYLRALSSYWQAEHALTPKIFALREQLAQTRRDAWK
jgi:hypothetical protein